MLPKDPFILYSVVNARLRDTYPNLDALCEDHDITAEELCAALSAIGFSYDPAINQFR